MDDFTRASSNVGEYTTDYVKRLLIERRYIYAKLYNPGGSVILRASDIVDHDRPVGYSTEIGNTFHLDLIDLETELQKLVDEKHCSKKEIQALLTWADGFTAQQAADYMHATGAVNVRKLRSRGMRKLQEQINHGSTQESGGPSDRDTGVGRKASKDDVVQDGHTRQSQKIAHSKKRTTVVNVNQRKGDVNADSQ